MSMHVALGNLVEIRGGGTPSKDVPEYWSGSIPWASVKDFKSARLSGTADCISEAGVRNSATQIIPAGCIIVPTRMAVGKAAINEIDLAINQDLKALFPAPGVDTKYLLHAILAHGHLLEKQATGATVKGITLSVLRSLEIPLPPLDEQRRIAAILDKADSLRQKRKQAIALLDSLKSALVENLINDAGKQTTALGEQLSFLTSGGRNWSRYYAEKGSRFIRSLDVQMNSIGNKDVVYVQAPQNAEARRTRTEKGDVLLTITGSRIGRVSALPDSHIGAYVSQHVAILRPSKAQINPHFLSNFLSSTGGQKLISKWQYGQTKPGLNFEQIKSFQIPKIDIDTQNSFVSKIEQISHQALKCADQEAGLASLFASLQHRAFAGEL